MGGVGRLTIVLFFPMEDQVWPRFFLFIGWFTKIVVLQNVWFIMENPIKMDDLGVPPFKETSILLRKGFIIIQTFHPVGG